MLTADNYTRQWYAVFMEGSHADTDWQVGSKALFTDAAGDGIAGKIAISNPGELLDIEYYGIVTKGKEDYESETAQKVKGGHEIYKLISENGYTNLSVELDMDGEWMDMMDKQWDEAIKKIKELSETPAGNNRFSLIQDLLNTKYELLKAFNAFNEEDVNRVPFSGSWTPAQVMEHIRKADGGVAEVLQAPAKPIGRQPDEKAGILKGIFLNMDAKYQSPEDVVPEQKNYDKYLLVDALESTFDSLTTSVRDLNLNEAVTAFEIPGVGEMTRQEFILFVIYHTQRHAHQLKNIYNNINNQN